MKTTCALVVLSLASFAFGDTSTSTCTELGWSASAKGTDNTVCGNSLANGVCSGVVTYADALDFCDAIGARLCTKNELADDEARNTGCALDRALIWSSTSCGTLEVRAAYGSSLVASNGTCTSTQTSTTYNTRCCADTVISVAETTNAPSAAPVAVTVAPSAAPVSATAAPSAPPVVVVTMTTAAPVPAPTTAPAPTLTTTVPVVTVASAAPVPAPTAAQGSDSSFYSYSFSYSQSFATETWVSQVPVPTTAAPVVTVTTAAPVPFPTAAQVPFTVTTATPVLAPTAAPSAADPDVAVTTDTTVDSAAAGDDKSAAGSSAPDDTSEAITMASISIVGIIGAGILFGGALSYNARKSRAAAGEVETQAQEFGDVEMATTPMAIPNRRKSREAAGKKEIKAKEFSDVKESTVPLGIPQRRKLDEVEDI